jgi:hypothetical protein
MLKTCVCVCVCVCVLGTSAKWVFSSVMLLLLLAASRIIHQKMSPLVCSPNWKLLKTSLLSLPSKRKWSKSNILLRFFWGITIFIFFQTILLVIKGTFSAIFTIARTSPAQIWPIGQSWHLFFHHNGQWKTVIQKAFKNWCSFFLKERTDGHMAGSLILSQIIFFEKGALRSIRSSLNSCRGRGGVGVLSVPVSNNHPNMERKKL